MPKATPPAQPQTKHEALQRVFSRRATEANDAMSAVLATLAGMTHDAKMNVMRAVIAYGEAEHKRQMALIACEMAKKVQAAE